MYRPDQTFSNTYLRTFFGGIFRMGKYIQISEFSWVLGRNNIDKKRPTISVHFILGEITVSYIHLGFLHI